MNSDRPSRHGPTLPYSVVAGVTPVPRGVAGRRRQAAGHDLRPRGSGSVETFVDVVDQRPTYSIIALNAPVGGLDQAKAGGRTCDREARPFWVAVGPPSRAHRSTSIHRTGTNLLPDHIDAISRTLLPRYQEVASEMAPFRQRMIYEVNAELSFFQLNEDVPMQWSKHSEKGIEERRSLLEAKIPGVRRIIEAEVPGATPSHLLDVAAILWTARRIFAKAAVPHPH